MSRRLALVAILAVTFGMAAWPHAQIATYPTPAPSATADNEEWYTSGGPIVFGGIIYYPSGPIQHFDRNEMLQVGSFGAVPVYVRTTREPGSLIYVPISGGLVRPYEQRRSGDLAGTSGSVPPSYPPALPADERDRIAGARLRAAAPPTGMPVSAFGVVSPAPEAAIGAGEQVPRGTSESGPAGPTHVRIGPPPSGINGLFIDYGGRRWFATGPAVERRSGLEQIGEHAGFPVFADPASPGVIYLPVVAGRPDLLTPYGVR